MRIATTEEQYPHLFRAKIEGSISEHEFNILTSNPGMLTDAENICMMYFYFQAYGYSESLALKLFQSQYNSTTWTQIGKLLPMLMRNRIASSKIDESVFGAILMDAYTPSEILFGEFILPYGVQHVRKNPVLPLFFVEEPEVVVRGARTAYGENGPTCVTIIHLVESLVREIQSNVAKNRVPTERQLELLQFFMDRVVLLGNPEDKLLPQLLNEPDSWTRRVNHWAIAFQDKQFDSDRDNTRSRCSESVQSIAIGNPRRFPTNLTRSLLDVWMSKTFVHKDMRLVLAMEKWVRQLEAHFNKPRTPLLLDIIQEDS